MLHSQAAVISLKKDWKLIIRLKIKIQGINGYLKARIYISFSIFIAIAKINLFNS